MNVIVNEDNYLNVMSDLYVHGRHPEDGTEIIGEAFYIVLETDSGERLRLNHSFPSIFEIEFDCGEEGMAKGFTNDPLTACEKAERLADRIRQAGSINTERWSYMEPRYGSAAYVDQAIEAEVARRERMAG